MKLRTGNLVTPNVDDVNLYPLPPALAMESSSINVLKRKELAIVIALDRTDGRAAYVIGPRGGGWAFGAFLTRVA